jgi:hypothetical protein
MICFRNINANTLHKEDGDDDDDNRARIAWSVLALTKCCSVRASKFGMDKDFFPPKPSAI